MCKYHIWCFGSLFIIIHIHLLIDVVIPFTSPREQSDGFETNQISYISTGLIYCSAKYQVPSIEVQQPLLLGNRVPSSDLETGGLWDRTWLVVWNMFFAISNHSSQLTHIFQRGRPQPPSYIYIYILYIYHHQPSLTMMNHRLTIGINHQPGTQQRAPSSLGPGWRIPRRRCARCVMSRLGARSRWRVDVLEGFIRSRIQCIYRYIDIGIGVYIYIYNV